MSMMLRGSTMQGGTFQPKRRKDVVPFELKLQSYQIVKSRITLRIIIALSIVTFRNRSILMILEELELEMSYSRHLHAVLPVSEQENG